MSLERRAPRRGTISNRPCDDLRATKQNFSEEDFALLSDFFNASTTSGAMSSIPLLSAFFNASTTTSGALVSIPFRLISIWHPRFQFFAKFPVPTWLANYYAVHFVGCEKQSQMTISAVHLLYHSVLENSEDRQQMSLALSVGETIAITRLDKSHDNEETPTAVAAVTFAQIKSSAVILFLVVDPKFQHGGFGTHLMTLVGKCLLHRKRSHPRFFLAANEQDNKRAWKFYKDRGLKEYSTRLPDDVQKFFEDRKATKLTHASDSGIGLNWLWLEKFEECYNCGPREDKQVSMIFMPDPCRHTDPLSKLVEDEMVYAQFPGALSLREANWCGKDLAVMQLPDIFETNQPPETLAEGVFLGLPKQEMVVSWRSRVQITPGVSLMNPAIAMLLAWFQRDKNASIWNEKLTLVPPCIMTPLWTMHLLFIKYLEHCSRSQKNASSTEPASESFHTVLDEKRFMENASIVVNFIDANKSLFIKPFIVMFGENYQMDATCFISVNASQIEVEHQHRVNEKVCGFINYDPIADDDCFCSAPIVVDEDPFLLFLTLAHCLLGKKKTSSSEQVPFNGMVEFKNLFDKAPYCFGPRYVASRDERLPYFGDAKFVQLAIPTQYSFRLDREYEHLSKLGVILFFLDFCVTATDKHFVWSSSGGINLKPERIPEYLCDHQIHRIGLDFRLGTHLAKFVHVSKTLSQNKNKSNREKIGQASKYLIRMFLHSVVILTDRLARSVYGEIRKESELYQKYLTNKGQALPVISKLPLQEGKFTDRCGLFGWMPLAEVQTAAPLKPPPPTAPGTVTFPPALVANGPVAAAASQPLSQEERMTEAVRLRRRSVAMKALRWLPQAQRELALEASGLGILPPEVPKNRASNALEPPPTAPETAASPLASVEKSPVAAVPKGPSPTAINPDTAAAEKTNSPLEENLIQNSSQEATETDRLKILADVVCDKQGDDGSAGSPKDNTCDGDAASILLSIANTGTGSNSVVEEDVDDLSHHSVAGSYQLSSSASDYDSASCLDGSDPASSLDGNKSASSLDPEEDSDAAVDEDEIMEIADELEFQGFSEGNARARAFEDLVPTLTQTTGSLPCFEKAALPVVSKKRKATHSPNKRDFIAVGPPISDKTSRKRRDLAEVDLQAIPEGTLCVAGNACKLPPDRKILRVRANVLQDRVRACSSCSLFGHDLCLSCRRNKWLCPECLLLQRRKRTAPSATKAYFPPLALEPPPELLKKHKFIRPNITKKMRACLDEHLKERDFPTEEGMRDMILAHNTKLRESKTRALSKEEGNLLRKADHEIKALRKEWKICHQILRKDYLRTTRCLVKSLAYDQKKKSFIAWAEWEEEAVDLGSRTGRQIPVIMHELLPVESKWVKKNFKRSVYVYLQHLARMADGKFMPVPSIDIFLDTRLISHYKWARGLNDGDGGWVVKFSNSNETEIIEEADLLRAGSTITKHSLDIAKTFAASKAGFIHIPPGTARSVASSDEKEDATKFIIHFPQDRMGTCVYSSFASALWCLDMFDLAFAIGAAAPQTEGDPKSFQALALFVRNFATWLTPMKIKKTADFDLLGVDLSTELAVVSLRASDGTSHHAVTVHDGFIFDSNEKTALILNRFNLDMLCSTENRPGKFEGVRFGYLFADCRQGDDNRLKQLKTASKSWCN